MKYKITQAYCWYNQCSMIVKMYFIQDIPFTFDELPEIAINAGLIFFSYAVELTAISVVSVGPDRKQTLENN